MKILYLHGWQSTPGGVKPSYLANAGHELVEPSLPDEDFAAAARIAEEALAASKPDLIVGSSRGGAVAMNMQAAGIPRVVLCPAWKRWGSADRVPAGTIILHAPDDDVVPFADSVELVQRSGLPDSALVAVGHEHRLADPQSLAMLLRVVESGRVD
ncbi:MAG: hypothetical protein H6R26_3091 [Proteobacteria bacterium]|nr:hypothetical protein [Pseudomonadota bacterium]